MRKMELSWRRNYNAENIADWRWRRENSMTQKKRPASTGPTTKTLDNSDIIISDCLEFLKSLYPEPTIGDGTEAFVRNIKE